jgi:uncharacterized DUF497 family protein
MRLIFEWDTNKAKANLIKHGIDFEEAKTVFADDLTLTFRDDLHSDNENRYLSIGMSANGRILLVVHTEEDEIDSQIVIRIISSRKATSSERKIYEKSR